MGKPIVDRISLEAFLFGRKVISRMKDGGLSERLRQYSRMIDHRAGTAGGLAQISYRLASPASANPRNRIPAARSTYDRIERESRPILGQHRSRRVREAKNSGAAGRVKVSRGKIKVSMVGGAGRTISYICDTVEAA